MLSTWKDGKVLEYFYVNFTVIPAKYRLIPRNAHAPPHL